MKNLLDSIRLRWPVQSLCFKNAFRLFFRWRNKMGHMLSGFIQADIHFVHQLNFQPRLPALSRAVFAERNRAWPVYLIGGIVRGQDGNRCGTKQLYRRLLFGIDIRENQLFKSFAIEVRGLHGIKILL